MSAPRPPRDLVQRLTAYDPRLRVRWAVRTHRWLLERQMPPQSPQWLRERPSPYKSARGLDIWDGWREGYIHVMGIDPEMLHWSLVEPALAEADAQAQGGFEALSKKLDAIAAAEEAAADKHIENWNEAAAHEAFDRLQWLFGNRIAVNQVAAEAPEKDVVEEHEGFTVRLRRRVSVEA